MKRRAATILIGAVAVLVACGESAGTSGSTRAGLQLVGEPRIVPDPMLYQVEGRITNTAARPYSGFVKVTLLNESGAIVGTYTGAVSSLAPGEEATYTAVGNDKPERWARVEARVENQVPG